MDRIAEESQINDDDFARRFGLLIKTRGCWRHVVLLISPGGRFGERKIAPPMIAFTGRILALPPSSERTPAQDRDGHMLEKQHV
jgi:hypothetical protein